MPLHRVLGALLSFALPLLSPAAQAGTAYCALDVYTAYTKAAARGWSFSCSNATFVPEQASRAISCQGRTPPQIPGGRHTIRGAFFSGQDGALPPPHFRNGWQAVPDSMQISGGKWIAETGDGRTRFGFRADLGEPNTQFQRRLTSLKLKKEDGDCSKVYDEAF